MIIISLDPSIVIKNFGVALFDTSIHQDPYKCLLKVESPEDVRKQAKNKVISSKADPDGKLRSEFLVDWFWDLVEFGHYEYIQDVVLLTESLVNKASWASTPNAKAGRAKKISLTQRANDYIMALAHIYHIKVIELDPTKYRSTKIQRSQKLDMILGTDREPRNEHYDDCVHRGGLWITGQKFK